MKNRLINRCLELDPQRSYLLLGPRRTGKSTFLKHHYPDAHLIDLLKSDIYFKYRSQPSLLRDEIVDPKKVTVIDEVQLIPELMREVHWLIENQSRRFIVSGSSARKLRRQELTNLAGRLRTAFLHPFTHSELGPRFDLKHYLQFGGLPVVWSDDEPTEALKDYCGEYLKEEIQAEGVVRQLNSFVRFLEISAAMNGQLVNYSNIARDVGVSAKTVADYLQILVDTLIGHTLDPYTMSAKRRAIRTPKFYFFDCGIPQSILNRTLSEKTPEFGHAFEHFIFLELIAARDYQKTVSKINYWRSASGYEVDFVIDQHTAIEVKSGRATEGDARGLMALAEDMKLKNLWVVSRDDMPRKLNAKVAVVPWQEFLSRLVKGEF